ncbi:hypothetical protein ACVR0C_06495 [Streptococcus downii]|uniref:Uncharacterized protein n=2 Tax=Streptococcus TaxID=1301 RepID=A0A1X1JC09_STROR|nr:MULTISPECIES: hypothetical protein [Streptococcus]ORO84046.1 hypothetical protein B7705_03785 [Streptococcus oralis subsp. dentisani]
MFNWLIELRKYSENLGSKEIINKEIDLISEFEYNNDFYRVYELCEDNTDYARIVSKSKKGMYIESTKKVKMILGLNTEK